MFGVRFVDGGNDVVWSVATILTSFRPFRQTTTTILMVAVVVIAAVTVASFIGAIVATAS